MINLPTDYMAALGVFVLTWLGMKGILALVPIESKALARLVTDRVLNLFFLFVAGWKLSPLVFQFSTVMKEPLALAYLPGGLPGVWVGMGVAGSFGLWRAFHPGRKVPADQLNVYRRPYLLGAGLLGVLGILALVLSPFAVPKTEAAPDFRLQDSAGQEVSLSSFRGRTVVLNFWASWCPPCRAEFPQLEEFAKTQQKKSPGAVLLGINATSTEPSLQAAREFLDGRPEVFSHLWDVKGEVQKLFGVTSLPTTLVIDPDGRVVSRRTGAVTAWLLEEIIPQ